MTMLRVIPVALLVAACDSVTMWLAPNTSCADWQHLPDDNRVMVVDQIVRGASLLESVRVAQHEPVGTPEEELVALAVASVTKNCDLQRWSPEVRVKDVVRDLYVAASSAGRHMPLTQASA
jgi:hypothetical protein